MFKYLFIIIIVFIILRELYMCSSSNKITETLSPFATPSASASSSGTSNFFNKEATPNNSIASDISTLLPQNENKEIIFDKMNPWSKVIIRNGTEFPYNYYIPVTIPSLNTFQNWKNIIPNLDFNPQSGELIVPSKDEGSALALTNLIIANLHNQLTIDEIIDKQLIQISVAKAQAHELVRNKLREQILDNINGGKIVNAPVTNYEKDLASTDTPKMNIDLPADIESYNSKKQVQVKDGDFEAFEGGDEYSYI